MVLPSLAPDLADRKDDLAHMKTLRRALFALACGASLTLAQPAFASEPRGPFNQDPGSGTPGGACSSTTGCHQCRGAGDCIRVYNSAACTCTATVTYNIDGTRTYTCSVDGTCTYR